MSQNISVHSTDDSGTNIIPGIDDGGAGVGNGSTYQIFRNDAPTADTNRKYWAKDKDGNIELIASGSSGGGVNEESNTFTRAASAGSGVQTITTANPAKLVFFHANNSDNPDIFSEGKDDGSIANSALFDNSAVIPSQSNSINVVDGGDGYTAKITAITANSYDVTWVKLGAGANVTVQWHAMES